MDQKRAAATIREVAFLAGLSEATVSRALNGTRNVDPKLADRVNAAAEKLSYRPSRVAQSLRVKRSKMWALVISDIRNTFFTEILRGIEEIAWESGTTVMVCNTDDKVDREASYLEMLHDENIAGVIISPASSRVDNLRALLQNGTPVVSIDRYIEKNACDSVMVDNHKAAREAVNHLLDQGYNRVACITGPQDVSTARERGEGWALALEERGIHPATDLIRFSDFQLSGGREAMTNLLEMKAPPDAVFVTNNQMTMGALHSIFKFGIVVPTQLGVVGFDDEPWTTIIRPALTIVRQPNVEIGRRAGKILFDRINGESGPARVIMDADLIVRKSSIRENNL